MPQLVPIAGRIELALHVVSVCPTKPRPRGHASRLACSIEAIRNAYPHQVADEITIMEVVPDPPGPFLTRGEPHMKDNPAIAVVGTFDSKGEEHLFLKERIEARVVGK